MKNKSIKRFIDENVLNITKERSKRNEKIINKVFLPIEISVMVVLPILFYILDYMGVI